MSQTGTQTAVANQDNMLGICHAIASDLGFNPLYLRLILAVMIIVSPEAMIITYGALGLIVLASRLIVRKPKPAATVIETRPAAPVYAPLVKMAA